MFRQFGIGDFLKFLTNWAITGLILLFVEMAIENIHIFSLNRSVSKSEREVLKLRAEIYELRKELTGEKEESDTFTDENHLNYTSSPKQENN